MLIAYLVACSIKPLCRMPRIKLTFPEPVLHTATIPIRITDLNYGGHVGNDALLAIVHEARLQLLRHLGYENELNVEGMGLIMADVGIQFKAEAFYGQTLSVALTADEITPKSFGLYYRATDADSGQEILLAKTGMLCFDYQARKVAPLPEGLTERLTS